VLEHLLEAYLCVRLALNSTLIILFCVVLPAAQESYAIKVSIKPGTVDFSCHSVHIISVRLLIKSEAPEENSINTELYKFLHSVKLTETILPPG
jgi:hypothetical protein